MKKASAAKQIAQYEENIKASLQRWNDIKENGCSDPFWPDGVNMNLIRNQIIYAIRKITEIDNSKRQLSVFDMPGMLNQAIPNDKRIPPKVDDNYMAKDRYDGHRRIKV